MNPESRKTQLLSQAVGDELVIYDEQSHEAHHLSPTAAVVWEAANGERSVPELTSILRESLAATPAAAAVDEADGEDLVRLALDELDRVGLLVRGLPGIRESMSRREMLGVAAALLPVVASIVAPTPAMAQTLNPFSGFNGTYTGSGTPDPGYNHCNIGPGPVSMVLALGPSGTGPLNITHTQANRSFAHTVSVRPQSDPNRVIVSGPGVNGGLPCDFTFARTGPLGPYSVTGHHDLSTGGGCESTFFIEANKP